MTGTRYPVGIPYKDANSNLRYLDAFDQSGVGNGPFATVHVLSDSQGNLVNPALDASLQGIGQQADVGATTDLGIFSIVSLIKRGLTRWTTLLSILPSSLGQKTMNGSVSVALALDQPALSVSPAYVTWVQTSVTLPAGVSTTLIGINGTRKALYLENVGTNPFTFAPGLVTVVAGGGRSLNPPSSIGYQGGSADFSGEYSTQAFSGISTGGTTVIVWEGN